MRKSNIFLLWLTPIYIWIAQLTAYIHEYAHSFTAWSLGFKANPLDIIYGGFSWQNLILLANIDENVNYVLIDQLGHRHLISLIAFAGPGIATLSIYLITLYLLRKKYNKYLYCLVFWINLINLRELWAYVPLRALSTTADIANINYSLGLSSWWIFILISPLVAWAVWNFFSNTIGNAYEKLGLFSISSKATLLILTVVYFFALTWLQILTANYNFITNTLTWSSIIAMPLILFFYWPKKTPSYNK
ncbi:MAG: hypothetical protein A3F18_07235 [Legionellales bacterium RIFCSPHIGHO2_12_FULL_37_14]|nr:MAG: hypothetical protein A3F18_07235 [Legionellales bacterium RIFCSPHIGHO2_12_FULL_37_14]